MPYARYHGPPMDLANMRAQGVRSLWVVCDLCHHEATMNVDGYGDAVRCPRSALGWSARTAASSARMRGPTGRSAGRKRA
jgi:hypothetical protein